MTSYPASSTAERVWTRVELDAISVRTYEVRSQKERLTVGGLRQALCKVCSALFMVNIGL